MTRKFLSPILMVSGLVIAVTLGWYMTEGKSMSDILTHAAAEPASLKPLTEAHVKDQLRARLADVSAALGNNPTPEQQGALVREFDRVSRALSAPAASLKQASDDRALLVDVQNAFGLPATKDSAQAEAALKAGDIAAAAPLFADIRAQAEADIRRAAKAAYALGRIAMAQGDLAGANGFFRRAASLDSRYDYVNAAQSSAIQLGQPDVAMTLANPLLQAAQAEFGEVSAERADALSQVAQVFLMAKKPADAEKLLREAIAVGETATGGKDEAQAKRLNNLAATLRAAGFTKEAEPLYRQAIAIDRAAPHGAYLETATRLSNLAELLVATGRAEEADALYVEAIKATRQSSGPSNPDLAGRIATLADLRGSLGKNEEALPLYLEAVEASRVSLGTDHPEFRNRLDRIAGALRRIGKTSEAEKLYRELISLTEAADGKDSADYARALNNLALLLADGERRKEAETLYRESLAILTKTAGPDSAETRQVTQNLGALLAKSN
ncbi:tetratricopeptide repeat protein [Pseudorhodobacter sp.]|uniref:tetratricopeptide repeat protein n=1 Tax=Pseudorhodobacter sp. TaxID=1934400 RepID=UPI0026480107|nr:tetratricopeptide repeat protein [Pseudorhodobacter sp.]MDN5787263.1 tetratricopeptide repeat protein [Pseudorhodobacter sp.]